MITIVDYGCGNLFSLQSSFRAIGMECVLAHTAEEIRNADKLVLPGVGAFGAASVLLNESGMKEALLEQAKAGVPLLGVCLGMQLLFEESEEFGTHKGLGLLKGKIKPFADVLDASYKIPHMGWNSISLRKPDVPLLKNTKENDFVYFVHSFYAAECEESILAYADYGICVPAVVGNRNVYGTQFHPEKSGEAGLRILRAFAEL